MEEFLRKTNRFIVVGATIDKNKWGNKVLRRLHELGFWVVGVNPKYREVEGLWCFSDLKTAKEAVVADGFAQSESGEIVVVTVVPPKVTEEILLACSELSLGKVWMQPGSESDSAVLLAKKLGIETVQACIVVDGLGEKW